MSSTRKLIVVLIDGLSANYFKGHRSYLPHLSSLMRQGTVVERLEATVPGTSMPGRATMLSGVAADLHGVYGNHILRDGLFRCAGPHDVRVPTIAARCSEAGLDVASIGAGMVRPEDAAIYVPPWWERGFLQRSRFAKQVPEVRLERARTIKDPFGRLRSAGVKDVFGYVGDPRSRDTPPMVAGLAGDHLMISATAALACSDAPPDLILTEIAMTDSMQHDFGFESEVAHWSVATADLLIGSLTERLRQAGRHEVYTTVVASDHGHSVIEKAIFPQAVIPYVPWMSEGATLHVLVDGDRERARVTSDLTEVGAEPWTSNHIPPSERDMIATFVAPPRHDFEETPLDVPPDQALGAPRYVSSHGFRPGSEEDDRVCLFAGPGLPVGSILRGAAGQFAPTLGCLLGLHRSSFPSESFISVS